MALNVIRGAAKAWSLSDQRGQTAPSGLTGSAAFDPKRALLRDFIATQHEQRAAIPTLDARLFDHFVDARE
jgi:hypothetical protein